MPVNQNNYMYRQGTAPNTRAAISQKAKIYGYSVGAEKGFKQIGCLSEFGTDESRTIDPVRGIGYGDQIAELVPSVTEPMTITANKTLLYAVNLFQVFGYKGGIDGIARSLKHHRWPFDIKEELVFSEIATQEDALAGPNAKNALNVVGNSSQSNTFSKSGAPFVAPKALFTFYEGCWMNSYSKSYTSDTAMVSENSQITVSDIIDGFSQYGEYIDTGLAPTGDFGGPGAGYSVRFAGGGLKAGPVTV